MRYAPLWRLLAAACLAAGLIGARPAAGQKPPPPPPPQESPPAEAPPVETPPVETPPVEAPPVEAPPAPRPEAPPPPPAQEEDEGRRPLYPKVDIFFPEGDFDFRLSRLVKNAFFEGQFKYNFVKGDITAFLRYRYYGYERTYQLGFFDAVEFEPIEELSNDFDRVRGGLLLIQHPHSLHSRTFFLGEVDRITSNKEELRFSTNRTNTFLRLGYQIGTPDDERANAIVGETRARIQRLFTAHRAIGPYGAGLTGALTWGFDDVGGDFDYAKFEFEALKRYNLPRGSFLIHRLHGGTFGRKVLRPEPEDDLPLEDLYLIPRAELFRLDGRERLKGLDERRRGTDELDTTVEYFHPWFLNQNRRALKLDWENWYWILYGGYGTIGFDRDVYSDTSSYVPDVGFGFEATFRLRRYSFFVSGIVAYALEGEGDPKGKLSIKSFH